jgi:hypothetical protein
MAANEMIEVTLVIQYGASYTEGYIRLEVEAHINPDKENLDHARAKIIAVMKDAAKLLQEES